MRKGRYEEIIRHANNIASINARLAYIEGSVETNDLDHTDYNAKIILLRKELIKKIVAAGKK